MIEFMLNGEQVTFNGDPETPLLWVIRDSFKLKGSKFGCGDQWRLHHAPRRHRHETCVLPIAAVAGKTVTTIEGLGTPDSMHPLQQAWVEHNVPQCGYCQSGQIMTAAALLAANPDAAEADIDTAMAGNICRCGCYPRIKGAIQSVASNTLGYDAMAEEVAS